MKNKSLFKKVCCVGLSAIMMSSTFLVGIPYAKAATNAEITMNVISDLHYYPLSLSNGESSPVGSDFRLKNESTAAVDAAIKKIINNKPEMVVITGDLTNNGEQKSAEELADKLQQVEEAGVPVFVINGNHDIQGSGGEDISVSEFRNIFKDFGYNGEYDAEYYQPTDTSDEDAIQGGLSYVVSPKPGVKLLMIDAEVYTSDYEKQSEGMISDDLMNWILKQINEARNNGETIVAGMHHPLLSHYSGEQAGPLSDTIDNSVAVADKLANAGLKYVLSGHMHENDITERTNNKGNKIIDMETGSLVAYGAPIRTVTASKDDISIQSESVKEINWNGETVNYKEYMDKIIYPDGFFIGKANGAVNQFLDVVQKDSLKSTIENLAGIDINGTLSGYIRSALEQPIKVDINLGEIKGIELSYKKENDSVIIHVVSDKISKLFPDLIMSVNDDILNQVDKIIKQIDDEWITDKNGNPSKLKQKVTEILNEISDMIVYTDSKGNDKTFSDFLSEILKEHNYGREKAEGWTKKVIDDFKIELTRSLAKDILIPNLMDLIHGILKETTINLQEMTHATGAWKTILSLLGKTPSIEKILKIASVDIDKIIDDLIVEYVDNDSYVGMVGQPLSGLAAGFLNDTTGIDDKIDGEKISYNIKDSDPNAQAELNFKSLSVGMGSNQNSVSFTWFANTGEKGSVQIAKKIDKPEGKSFPTDSSKYIEVKSENFVTSSDKEYYTNRAVVNGLDENTDYIYRVGNEGKWESVHDLRINDLDGKFNFLFAGDPQIGSTGSIENDIKDWENSLNLATEKFNDTSFIISSGDQVNTSTSEKEYEGFLEHNALKGLRMATVVGNHDSGAQNYSDHFYAPNVANDSGTKGTGKSGGDYWFKYNGVLFMMLNSNNTNTEEHKKFMQETISENSDINWKVVAFHHSIYSAGAHSDSGDILMRREQWAPLFSEMNIDAVLMGHDHVYTRTFMMNGTTPKNTESGAQSSVTNPENGDVVYITANSASSKHYSLNNSNTEYAAVKNQENLDNITNIEVTPSTFKITTYRTESADHVPVSVDGMTVVDEFTINKNSSTSIVDKTAPKLTVPDDCTIDIGTEFNPMENVSAIDDIDNDLTEKIVVSGKVNVNVPGEYKLVYTVSDNSNNKTEVVRFVTVVGEISENAITLIDEKTNISVTGIIPEGSVLSVNILKSGNIYDKIQNIINKDKNNKSFIWDISLTNNNTIIELKNNITVNIPVPKDFDAKKVKLYQFIENPNGELEKKEIETSIKDNSIIFTVNTLGLFGITQNEKSSNNNSDSDINNNVEDNNKPNIDNESHQQNNNNNTNVQTPNIPDMGKTVSVVATFIITLAALCTGITVYKKRNNK